MLEQLGGRVGVCLRVGLHLLSGVVGTVDAVDFLDRDARHLTQATGASLRLCVDVTASRLVINHRLEQLGVDAVLLSGRHRDALRFR